MIAGQCLRRTRKTVGIGEIQVSRNPDDVLVSHGLGSCVAVIALDPSSRTVGMVHVAMPDSTADNLRASTRPGYFADTGIPAMLEEMERLGANRHSKRLIVKLVGGANVVREFGNNFDIGKRNILAVRRDLWRRRMGPTAEELGGNKCRTAAAEVATGRVTVRSPGEEDRRI